MAEKKDGRHYLTEIQEILTEVKPELPEVGMQEKVDELLQRGDKVQKKLFLKTQGGTTTATEAREQVDELEANIDGGANEEEIKQSFDKLVEKLEFFIHRAETMVIRMT